MIYYIVDALLAYTTAIVPYLLLEIVQVLVYLDKMRLGLPLYLVLYACNNPSDSHHESVLDPRKSGAHVSMAAGSVHVYR